jgi:phage FluMu protein Com
MKEVACLDCNTIFLIEDGLYIGLKVTCPECETQFEITYLSPVQIEWVYEDDYDYDLDDDMDDDDYEDEFDEEFDEEEVEAY